MARNTVYLFRYPVSGRKFLLQAFGARPDNWLDFRYLTDIRLSDKAGYPAKLISEPSLIFTSEKKYQLNIEVQSCNLMLF